MEKEKARNSSEVEDYYGRVTVEGWKGAHEEDERSDKENKR